MQKSKISDWKVSYNIIISGRSNTWAAGIIHALGMVNFLFDKSQDPYLSSKELADGVELQKRGKCELDFKPV